MVVKVIDASRAEEIARLAVCLTNEIIERTGIKHFDVDVPKAVRLCQNYLEHGDYTVVAALEDEEVIGFGALCESHSLYAEGAFGIVQEFYVQPAYRCKGVGRQLIEALREVARQKNWTRLELCTPPVPEFNRTVAFYQENGFEITGGYKMKSALSE
nr:GNAT family N-acetyltransferase [uncultured Desulfuromonas sp.]